MRSAGFTPGPIGGSRRISQRSLVLLIVLALVVGVGGTVAILFATGAFSTEIRAEPIQAPGDNPFMPPVGADQPNVTPPPNSAGAVSGGTTGLYGGTLNNSSCDPQKMVAFLMANPDKAAAWAAVQGITVAEIPAYVADLTPLVLRSDTAVTNHGFADGRATTVYSVLQAGTAVLVDKFGTPRARCYCGNPLTPATAFSRPRYVGSVWPSFSQTNIVIVQPVTQVINVFVIVNPVTNQVIYRPRGTQGEEDRLESAVATTPAPSPTPVPAPTSIGDVPEAFLGTWNGTIVQDRPPGVPPTAVTVSIQQGSGGETVGAGSYAALGCQFHWTLVSASSSQLLVNEVVDSGSECTNNVQITLVEQGNGTLRYDFENGNGRGVLQR